MNTYNPKHVLKFILPLLVLLTSCSIPGKDNSSTGVVTEAPVILSYSPTPTASLVAQMPTETIAPTFTSTSTPTTTPTWTPTLTSTPTPTETPTPLPTLTNTPIPQSVLQNDPNSSNNPSSPENPTTEAIPTTGSDVGPTDTAGAGDPPGVIEGFIAPKPPDEKPGQKTPTPLPDPICLVCTAD